MKTALYDRHLALGAKIVPFSGWQMPVQYQGVLAEHQAVRQVVGLFDVSHMGRIHVKGKDAECLLDFLSTNRVAGKPDGSVTYAIWCHPAGGTLDDVMIYKLDGAHFFVVVNASNRDKDLAYLKAQASLNGCKVVIEEHFEKSGMLALQGPTAQALLAPLLPEAASLKPMQVRRVGEGDCFISRTGYTGAGGFELYGPEDWIVGWWDLLLEKGKPIRPIGLGARDTLRLEMGFALYGHELHEGIAPNESVAAWAIKWDKPSFMGKDAMATLEREGKKRHAYGVRLVDKGVARQGCLVSQNGEIIGEVTSGSFSPTLGESIALILVVKPLQLGEHVGLSIRQTVCRAKVSPFPFLRKMI